MHCLIVNAALLVPVAIGTGCLARVAAAFLAFFDRTAATHEPAQLQASIRRSVNAVLTREKVIATALWEFWCSLPQSLPLVKQLAPMARR